jgi:MFS family permease
MTQVGPDPSNGPGAIRRVVLASFVGTAIEWYDFFLYNSASALIFNKLFFPQLDPKVGSVLAFVTAAIGFFARPLGGIVFGHFGDRLGRKSVLVITLMMMGLSTFLVGCLPTYASIGVAAPILLTALRFIQGFGVGGEWGGAVLMAVEHSGKSHRGFAASWPQAGVPAGLLLSSAVFALFDRGLGTERFLAWGWRCPFLIGILLVGVGLFIRLQVFESPLFDRLRGSKSVAPLPIVDVVRFHGKSVLLAMGARFAENVAFYVYSAVSLTYAVEYLKLPKETVLNGVLVASALELLTIPAYGALSDRWGRRPVYMIGAVLTGLLAFPFFWMAGKNPPWGVSIGLVLVLALAHAAMYGPQAAFFSELFGTRVRCTGASLGYQLASPLAGGLALPLCVLLLRHTQGHPGPVAWYVLGSVIITLICVYLAAETSREELL